MMESLPSLLSSSTSWRLSSDLTSPGTSTSTRTGISSSIDISDISGPTTGPLSSLSRSTSSLKPTPALTPSPSVAPYALPTPNGQFMSVGTASTTGALSSVAPQLEGNAFLKNKPLSGFVLGLAGLVVLAAVVIAVTFTVRRRHRKRLLADASNSRSDPKDVEDIISPIEEKSPHNDPAGLPQQQSRPR